MWEGNGNHSVNFAEDAADYTEVKRNDLNHFLHPYTHFDTFKKNAFGTSALASAG